MFQPALLTRMSTRPKRVDHSFHRCLDGLWIPLIEMDDRAATSQSARTASAVDVAPSRCPTNEMATSAPAVASALAIASPDVSRSTGHERDLAASSIEVPSLFGLKPGPPWLECWRDRASARVSSKRQPTPRKLCATAGAPASLPETGPSAASSAPA